MLELSAIIWFLKWFDNLIVLIYFLINSLIQGISHNCNKYGDLNSELSELNKELPRLYHEISVINDYLLFMKEEKITDKNPSQGSCVEVMLGSGGNKTEI